MLTESVSIELTENNMRYKKPKENCAHYFKHGYNLITTTLMRRVTRI